MKPRYGTYTGYSVGVAIVWAARLLITALLGSRDRFKKNLLVFSGFALGWLSATIARYVYPPPRKYGRVHRPRG